MAILFKRIWTTACFVLFMTRGTSSTTASGALSSAGDTSCPSLEVMPYCECRYIHFRVYLVCTRLPDLPQLHEALLRAVSPSSALWLRVDSGDVPTVGAKAFSHLRLHSVQINASNLSHVDADAFGGLEMHLRFLGLQDNLLEKVPVEALQNLPKLEMLSLVGNDIESVPVAAFQSLPSLRYLSLSQNKIWTLPRGVFGKGLQHLALSLNKLTSLNGSVRHLPDLEWLFLTGNQLTTLSGQLDHLPSLTLLSVSDNRLYEVGSAFSSPTDSPRRLHQLNLSRNRLTLIPNGAFAILNALRELDLSENAITVLAPHAFTGLENLVHLDLADNRLMSLESALELLTNLRVLNVSGNQLASLQVKDIKPLERLDTFDLSRNRITSIEGATQFRISSIRTLWLSANKLTSLTDMLDFVPSLQQLDVSHNGLFHLTQDTFAANSELRTLRIKGNPWVCNNNFVRTLLQLEANLTQIDDKPWCMNAVVQLEGNDEHFG